MHDNSNNNDDDGGYQDWNQDPMATVLICLFGVVVLSLMLLLAFSHKLSIRRQERQQQESSEEEQQRLALQKKKEKQKEIELQKQRWLGLMTRFQLSKVVSLSDFPVAGDQSTRTAVSSDSFSSSSRDVEMGKVIKDQTCAAGVADRTDEDEVSSYSETTVKDDNDGGDKRGEGEEEVANSEQEPHDYKNHGAASLPTSPKPISTQNYTEIMIPRYGTGSSTTTTRVPNLCAICLDGYEINDTIVWSNNPKCQHAFHDTCLMDYYVSWLRKKDTNNNDESSNNNPVCPCCRQVFFLKKKNAWKKTNSTLSSATTSRQSSSLSTT